LNEYQVHQDFQTLEVNISPIILECITQEMGHKERQIHHETPMKISKSCYAITGLSAETPWAVNSGFIVGDHSTLIIGTGSNA
jgi:hypothetical protein